MHVDHLVWYCADPAEGEAYFAARMDCRPVYGGVHPGDGTCNSLLSLADHTYIEILGRDPAQPASNLDAELQQLSGAGLYHWAAGGTDLAALRATALAAGLDGSEIVTGGRKLPNGNWLGWSLFGIKNHGFGALVPFFIDWMESEHPAKTAPRGGSFVKLEARSPEPEKLADIYRILGLDIPVTRAMVPGLSAIVESRSGTHTLPLIDPAPRGFII
jgi:hypothetical protein